MSLIETEHQGPVGLVTMNRPERHNAFDDALIADLLAEPTIANGESSDGQFRNVDTPREVPAPTAMPVRPPAKPSINASIRN